ncbi:MAG: hypothetical protein AAB527_02370 [Patescibacteria group bacterium]
MKRRDVQLELNQAHTTIEVFMKAYNQTLPQGFPVVSVSTLKKFQETYPLLFKNKAEWSIEKHRKRLMDWLPMHIDES